MFTSSSASVRTSRCFFACRPFQQPTRAKSTLSAVNRGLEGENWDRPRRSPPRPSRRDDDSDHESRSYARSNDRESSKRAPTSRSFDRDADRGKSYGNGWARGDGNRGIAQRPYEGSHGRSAPSDMSRGSRSESSRTFERNTDRATSYGRRWARRDVDQSDRQKSYGRSAPSDSTRSERPQLSKPREHSAEDNHVSIPYTTAASQFIYGLNVIIAALKSRRRTLHTLYLHPRAKEHASLLEQLASKAGVRVRRIDNNFLPVMDRMTADRPHNGVILEASPLPMPSVEELGEVQPSNRQIHLTLSQKQTAEERALYGTSQILPAPHESWRHPFVLLVDGVLDPGNLGNILRSAYFFGVDAVAICVNTCAPLSSPTLHKAASGATEALNILAIQRPADFVVASSRNGWRIHAAVAPEGDKTELSRPQMISQKMTSPLARGPSILMMGAEGEGLRKNLRSKARSNVIIAGRQRHSIGDIGVDSLNVSAATAVLLADFMTNPGEGWNRWSSARPTKPEPEGTMLSDEKSEKMNLPEEAEKLF